MDADARLANLEPQFIRGGMHDRRFENEEKTLRCRFYAAPLSCGSKAPLCPSACLLEFQLSMRWAR